VKLVEIRRHSLRDRPAEELSAAGRALAQEVGMTRGPFRRVVSSVSRRAAETAEAMVGHPPQLQTPLWFDLGDGEIPWPLSFAGYGRQVRENPVARALARQLGESVEQILSGLNEEEQALVATHGGFPELVSAHWATSRQLEELGAPCRCMEGVLLRFDHDRFAGAEALRVPESRTRM
jgi:broad specificity phosphatase PhoE